MDVHAYLLPSFIYTHVRKANFEILDRWVKRIPRNGCRWAFGICQGSHWIAVKIDWEIGSIQCYDPKQKTLSKRATKMLEVSAVEPYMRFETDIAGSM